MNNSAIAAPRLRQLRSFGLLFGLLMLAAILLQTSQASLAGRRNMAASLNPLAVSTATTYTVINTHDSGAGSLRQAIIDANNNPGLDTIAFNIGSGPQTITPLQRLPEITGAVVIDGATQPGFSGIPIIELNGAVQPDGFGLSLTGGNNTVRSLVLNGFHSHALIFTVNGGNRVEGCYIGTDITGAVANRNGGTGLVIKVSNNIIGGNTPAQRNVISGNGEAGIDINRCCNGDVPPVTGNVIQGNYIGVNAAGNRGLANQRQGIRMSTVNTGADVTGNMIGGTQAGAGNVISGNHFEGILLESTRVKNNSVQGNFIGTDATGSYSIPNDGDGVSISGTENLIGGSVPGARNVISGNGRGGSGISGGNGISLGIAGAGNVGPGNVVQGNIIGANAALTAALPNWQHGIAISQSNSVVGGVGPGEANIIAFSGADGIRSATTTATGNLFRGNSIFSNGHFTGGTGIGIDLGGENPTANDAGDADNGSNNLQNFPVITAVNVTVNSVNIQGTLNSTANQSFNLDFYANSVCDPQGYGEGARYLGSGIVTTDGAGNGTFNVTLNLSLPANQVVTATATDAAGNTSEFSQCAPGATAVGSVSFSPNFAIVTEGVDSQASFLVQRTGGSAGTLTVNYVVTEETATAGSDFTPTQGTLTFANGETSKTFTVPIVNDSSGEPEETARVSLTTTGALDSLGSMSFATLTIVDDDPPSISISDVFLNEGNSGTGTLNANFTVSLSRGSVQTVTVSFATADGTAHTGSDYFSNSGLLTFNPGQMTKSISVAVVGDLSFEPNETFFVNLSSPTNSSISDAQGRGTIINDDPAGGTIGFASPTFTVTELAGSILVNVNRNGDTTQAVTVEYATSDITADERKDYTPARGTLQFDVGISAKTIEVLVNVDAFNEGSELVLIRLSNPTGGAALEDSQTTLQIDNSFWTPPPANSIDDPDKFVRQHYHDFLNREASNDPSGLAFWTNQITECQQPGATCNAELRRINVSAAFFLSVEFQETGYLVYRIYKAGYGNLPGTPVPLRFAEFLPDTQKIGQGVVVGATGWEQRLESNKVAFMLDFVSRSRFTTAYPNTLTPAEFVDALFANAAVTPSATDRDAAINEFGGAENTTDTAARARSLRRVAENSILNQQETNKAFVLMQYFGYLRRNPNDAPEQGLNFDGYNFWLGKLNEFNGNFVNAEMVKAFLVAGEYRQRFGP
jgi:hypothetical protein